MTIKSRKTKIIAEIALTHNGSLAKAKKLIKKCKECGADYVKFQTHFAKYESSTDEKFRKGFNFKEKNRYNYWKKREFTFKEWKELLKYSKKINISFLSSPFSVEAFKMLKKIGLNKWKISSGEFFSKSLIDTILKTNDQIILSTGMSNLKEIKELVKKIKKNGNDLTVLQCTSKYPTKLEEVGLNVASYFKKKLKVKNGISDHSGSIFPSIEAIKKKIDLIEVHVEEKNRNFKAKGPDTDSSISFEELKIITSAFQSFEKLQCRVDKNKLSKKLSSLKTLFTKSICTKKKVKKGDKITVKNVCFKKPNIGIPENKIDFIINYKFNKDIDSNKIVKWSDVKK